jgi:uncharacterized DUF497 family protein
MPRFKWNALKSDKLKRERGVSFEEILDATLIDIVVNPVRPHQKVLLFEYHHYIWLVPFVENGDEYFLKTLFPSRKYTRLWMEGKLK